MVSVDTDLSDISGWIFGDIWSFGCSVLKIFLSYSGPHNQREVGWYTHTCVHMLCSDGNVTCNKGYTYTKDEVHMYGLGNRYILEIWALSVFNPFQNEVLWAYIYVYIYRLSSAQCTCYAYHSINMYIVKDYI